MKQVYSAAPWAQLCYIIQNYHNTMTVFIMNKHIDYINRQVYVFYFILLFILFIYLISTGVKLHLIDSCHCRI